MHLDHVIYAVGPGGLEAEAARFEDLLSTHVYDGGVHPGFGTQIDLVPMSGGRYVEIVEVLDHPAAAKVPYGQAVRERSALGGGWLGWVVSVDDVEPYEQRLGRSAVVGTRTFPDGRRLQWQQLGVKGLIADPQLPFFIHWVSEPSVLPSALPAEVALTGLEIAGNQARVEGWVGVPVGTVFDGVTIRFDSPSGYPGLTAVTFKTPKGEVRI